MKGLSILAFRPNYWHPGMPNYALSRCAKLDYQIEFESLEIKRISFQKEYLSVTSILTPLYLQKSGPIFEKRQS